MFEDSRSGFSAASENGRLKEFDDGSMISAVWLTWEGGDLDKGLGSATAGACPRVLR